jgi:hypothetical protein
MDLPALQHAIGKDLEGNPTATAVCDWYARLLEAEGFLDTRDGNMLTLGPGVASLRSPELTRGIRDLSGGRLVFLDEPREVRIEAVPTVENFWSITFLLAAAAATSVIVGALMLAPVAAGIAAAGARLLRARAQLRRFVEAVAEDVTDSFIANPSPPRLVARRPPNQGLDPRT